MKPILAATPLLIPLALLPFMLAGCGGGDYDGPARASVKGKVTFDGAPVDGGTIAFIPVGGDGRKAGESIVNGEYNIPEAKGPNTGEHRVEIRWPKPTGKMITAGTETFPETKEAIPLNYNDSSGLTAKIGSGENTFDFALTK